MVDYSWGDDAGGADSIVDLGKTGDDDSLKKRPRRVRKQDIEDLQQSRLDGTEKFISIWHRNGKSQPLQELIPKFSRKAAMVFSELWRKQLDSGAGVLIVEDYDMAPYKRIVDWINLCVDEGNDVKFPEIEAANALHAALDVIHAADYIQVPPMSLQEHLKKDAARKYARKALIDIDYVSRIYDAGNPDSFGENEVILQEAAATSILEAWWNGTLDEKQHDEYCMYIEQMRVDFPKLDEDINARYKDKLEFMEKRREERRAGKTSRNGGVAEGATADAESGLGLVDGADGGWGDAGPGTGEGAASEWGAGKADGVAAASGTGNGEWSAAVDTAATEDGGAWGNTGGGW